jgi:hypothetical protein
VTFLCLVWVAAAVDVAVMADGLDDVLVADRLAAAGLAPAQSSSFFDLMLGAKPSLSKGKLVACQTKLPLADTEEAVERAEHAVSYREFTGASEHLALARRVLTCADAPVPPELGARIYLLSGYTAAQLGDSKAAVAYFQRTHLFMPGLQWPGTYALESKALFEEAELGIYMVPPSRIYVTPAPADRWLIDGAVPEVVENFFPLPSGEHLLQVVTDDHIASWNAHFESGETNLLLPALAPPEAAVWADDPAKREALDAWLANALPAQTEVVVVTASHLWVTVVGSNEWSDAWEPVVAQAATVMKRRKLGWGLVAGGGGAAVAAGALAGWSFGRAISVKDAADDPLNMDAWDASGPTYNRSRGIYIAGGSVAAAGLAVAGCGVFLTQYGAVQPGLVSASPGVRFRVGLGPGG